MPLTINVGLSRKSSANYQSEGVSLNLTAELDQSLLANPARLQAEVAGLYSHAREALERQVHGGPPAPKPRAVPPSANGRGEVAPPRPATAAQFRALHAVAKRLGLDLDRASNEKFGYPAGDLDVRQASALIDVLKQQEAAPRSNGTRRS